MSERQLVFRDAAGHKKSFVYGDGSGDHLTFMTAWDTFVQKHVSEENTTFRLERTLTDEVLLVETAFGILCRVRDRSGESPESGYRHYERYHDGVQIIQGFARNGYAEVERYGPWAPDAEDVMPDDSFENLELSRANGFRAEKERRRAIRALPKLDRKPLRTFCKTWADTGHNEYVSESEVYYVLFDGRTREEAGAARDELLTTIETLGLHIVDTPTDASSGEVWVRADPRVDVELEKWG